MADWGAENPLRIRETARRQFYGVIQDAIEHAHETASPGMGGRYREAMMRYHNIQAAGQAAERTLGREGRQNPAAYSPVIGMAAAHAGPAAGVAAWGLRQMFLTHGHALGATGFQALYRALRASGRLAEASNAMGRALERGPAAAAAAHWTWMQQPEYRDWYEETTGAEE